MTGPRLDVCCVDSVRDRKEAIIVSPPQGAIDGPTQPYPTLGRDGRGSLTVLFCLIDDAYTHLNPHGARRYESIKRLADSEVITLALFQQLRGVESERSFLRDTERFFPHLFPGVVGVHPSSFHRRVRKLRRLEWSLCGGMSSLRWSGTRRRCLLTRRCFRFCTPCSGFSGLGLLWGGVGKVEHLQRLRGEGAPHLRHQRGSSLLRAHSRKRRRQLCVWPRNSSPRRSWQTE
jgi:hypothetical protein